MTHHRGQNLLSEANTRKASYFIQWGAMNWVPISTLATWLPTSSTLTAPAIGRFSLTCIIHKVTERLVIPA
jgi:hypothetical protein